MVLTESRIDVRPMPARRPGTYGANGTGSVARPTPTAKRRIPARRKGAAHGRVHS